MNRTLSWGMVSEPGLALLLWAAVCILIVGCGDHVRRPSPEEVTAFEIAGPSGPSVDMNRVVKAKLPTGPYRVVPGDILELQMPAVLSPQAPQGTVSTDGRVTFNCRVYDDGTIVLPVVGRLAVAGKTLAEIENAIIAEYFPRYVATLPPIHVTVLQYKTYRVSIMGSVVRPGIYTLRHDQSSLVALLMEAGGVAERGAAVIRITRDDDAARVPSKVTASQQRTSPAGVPQAGDGASRHAADRAATRAVFTREGPLNASGWLALERNDTVLVRRWLDLASESQRKALLQAASTTFQEVAVDDLQARLVALAADLKSYPAGRQGHPAMNEPGWSAMSDGSFVTQLGPPAVANASICPDTEGVTTLTLPVRGLNVPFADVALADGDSVTVEPPSVQFISVLGLVMAPGNFPYPPDARYNLAQAVAFAGGLNLIAAPRYVTIYRLNADGTIASVTVQLVKARADEQLTEALAMPLKPGDVVFVEKTPRTRVNVFLDRVLRISLGLYVTPDDFTDNND